MGKILGTMLRKLADFADNVDCDRPEDIMQHLSDSRLDGHNIEEMEKEIEVMQKIIGNIGRRVHDLEEKTESKKCKYVKLEIKK